MKAQKLVVNISLGHMGTPHLVQRKSQFIVGTAGAYVFVHYASVKHFMLLAFQCKLNPVLESCS